MLLSGAGSVWCSGQWSELPLAARGLAVTALEPGPGMAELAAQKTEGLGGVRVVEA